MKSIKLLEKYPKITVVLQEYLHGVLMESIKDSPVDMPEEFKTHLRHTDISEEKVARFIEHNPRLLFDFFDKKEIYVETHREKNKFIYKINGIKQSYTFKDRLPGDTQVLQDCFPLLEKQL